LVPNANPAEPGLPANSNPLVPNAEPNTGGPLAPPPASLPNK
jgi:hypothetical protein